MEALQEIILAGLVNQLRTELGPIFFLFLLVTSMQSRKIAAKGGGRDCGILITNYAWLATK